MKVSWSRCPHCNQMMNFQVEGGAGAAPPDFGEPKIFRCSSCRGPISNGLKEWKDLPFIGKSKAVLRTIYTVAFCGFGTGGMIAALAMYTMDLDEPSLLIFAGISISIATIFFAKRYYRILMNEIRDSNRRIAMHKVP